MEAQAYPPNVGRLAILGEQEKRQRLDVMVQLWQRESEQRIQSEGVAAMLPASGLEGYRYLVWLRFPEWERSVVVSQVLALSPSSSRSVSQLASTPAAQAGGSASPVLFSQWRHEPLLRSMPDWKQRLHSETVFNICVLITPASLGEGARWAIVMPRTMVARYRPAWPTQKEWVQWTQAFDWLSIGTASIRAMLQEL